jgi:hypothetical protein
LLSARGDLAEVARLKRPAALRPGQLRGLGKMVWCGGYLDWQADDRTIAEIVAVASQATRVFADSS